MLAVSACNNGNTSGNEELMSVVSVPEDDTFVLLTGIMERTRLIVVSSDGEIKGTINTQDSINAIQVDYNGNVYADCAAADGNIYLSLQKLRNILRVRS